MEIAFLPTKHLGVHMNSFKRVRAFQIELEFGSVVFEERGKPEYLEKNLSELATEPTTNSTHIWRQRRELNPDHIGGRRVLSPKRYPCSPPPLREVREGNFPLFPSPFDLPFLLLSQQREWNSLLPHIQLVTQPYPIMQSNLQHGLLSTTATFICPGGQSTVP